MPADAMVVPGITSVRHGARRAVPPRGALASLALAAPPGSPASHHPLCQPGLRAITLHPFSSLPPAITLNHPP
eukprot:712582-Rhodomonas_salina.1